MIYQVFRNEDGNVPVARFIAALKEAGLRVKDPRLKETMTNFEQSLQQEKFEGFVDEATFRRSIQKNIVLIESALRGDLVIPEFSQLTKQIEEIYNKCKGNNDGKVHKFVGHEPSGQAFNYLSLNSHDQPHNPMLNSGALVLCALQKPELPLSDRCEYVQDKFKLVAGGEYIGFSNSTFLSERETADRNYALGYYMNAHKAFPPNTNLMDTFELYFHTCSTETNCDSGSVMAATLANGGICPLTGQKVFSSRTVQSTLSLMLSCGMYDYSGQFAFHVGLPAKSGVSGAILIVVPKVCGMMIWSPPLDHHGNSVRGMQFCKELVNLFDFHNYDLKGASSGRKLDPRRRKAEVQGEKVVYLLYAASYGDVTALRRYYLSGTDMTLEDYDGRTALHVSAAQGCLEVVKFLLEHCNVPADPKDRWGFSPLDEAIRFNHQACMDLLKHHLQLQGKTSP
ncbi:hypothetical protein OS493_037354 [Desmophyllum pertusum]|uniref:glutaminase n=1 Tax=Desmophyllum pertusum TaxID=174260 RepID=A0A9W9YKZ6_9CNID|nr:hypothetical protein OS493_037354 [Desmophyllum pertusum]